VSDNGNHWSAPTSLDEVKRRAAGRRAYNRRRQFLALFRQRRMVQLIGQYGLGRGVQSRLARELGVSRQTISRDVAALLFTHHVCPTCGRIDPRHNRALLEPPEPTLWDELLDATAEGTGP
jgi:HTH domain